MTTRSKPAAKPERKRATSGASARAAHSAGLEKAVARVPAGASARAGHSAGPENAGAGCALYLFAIVDAAPARAVRGVEFVRAAGAWVAVARAAAPALSVEAAVEHDRVVRAVAARCDAVLPLRFGMSAPDERALVKKLAPFKGVIRAALARVRGAVQLTVRVSGREMNANERGRTTRADGPGTRFMKQRLAAERVPEIEPLAAALVPYVRDTRIQRTAAEARRGEHFASVFFLVERAHLAKWRRVVRSTTLDHVTLRVTGPWPPYAFAELR